MKDEWYFTRNGQQQGPVSTSELRQEASAGRLQPTDLVWQEGMPQWILASAARAIFPGPTAPGAEPAVLSVELVEPADEPRQHERPRRSRERGRQRAASGIGAGTIIAIIGGVSALIIVAVVIVVVVLVNRDVRTAGSGFYSVHLNEGGRDQRSIVFAAGRRVTIRVTSDHQTDVDLHVFDARNRLIQVDDGPHKDCFVEFVPPRSETYRIELVNLGPGFNRSRVNYQQP